MSTQSKPYLTPEEYLEIERKAPYKSEYYKGEMYAMSGARVPHVQIVNNASRELGNQLRGKPCQPLSSDMRVSVKSADLYAYPDIVVVCGEPQLLDNKFDTLTNPTVIIEVLSESTKDYDRGTKFELYRALNSLQEYLLISSLQVSAEHHARQPNGKWELTAMRKLEDTIELKSIDCRLRLADLYERVNFTRS